jgi:SAM-dependent methyltransferase
LSFQSLYSFGQDGRSPQYASTSHTKRATSKARAFVLDGVAEELPGEVGSFDAGLAALLLCTVPDPDRALSEFFRLIKPGGELRFYEHVVARRPLYAHLQRLADATFWPRMLGGCHPDRDTGAAIEGAGFVIERCERFIFSPMPFSPMAHILGVARRPAD